MEASLRDDLEEGLPIPVHLGEFAIALVVDVWVRETRLELTYPFDIRMPLLLSPSEPAFFDMPWMRTISPYLRVRASLSIN